MTRPLEHGRLWLIGAVVALLGGCAGPRAMDEARAIATPARIAPAAGAACRPQPRYDAVGKASWYGRRYHGRRTASGRLFDMNELTAAHRRLPFGTRVRVTNLANARSVDVVVTDRGPFIDGRIIDLSRRAADVLGFVGEGLATVRVRGGRDCG